MHSDAGRCNTASLKPNPSTAKQPYSKRRNCGRKASKLLPCHFRSRGPARRADCLGPRLALRRTPTGLIGAIAMQYNKIAALCLCATSVSASAGTGVTYETAAPRTDVITTDGMLGIAVGMTYQQVSHLFYRSGTNENRRSAQEPADCNSYSTRNGEASIFIQRGFVTAIYSDSPRLATPSGARVGMSEAALRRLYGNRLRWLRMEYSVAYVLLSDSGNGIRFTVSEGKVTIIGAGRRSSIEGKDGAC